MKSGYLLLLLVLAALAYAYLSRPQKTAGPEPKPAPTLSEEASAHFQKPLERTRATIKEAGKRNEGGEF